MKTRLNGATIGALAMCALALGAAPSPVLGAARTFVVNKTSDAADRHPGDGKCDSSTKSGLQCTLRAAIQEANAHTGADTINFKISTASKVIAPTSPLPPITQTVTIDGYSQPGTSANTKATGDNAVLKIVLDGVNAGTLAIGLQVEASNSVIRGLVIQRFSLSAIQVDGPSATIRGNFLGTDRVGAIARPNQNGLKIDGSNAVVGGTTPAARNVISGNTNSGVVAENCDGTTIQGNYIGTNAAGTSVLGNGESGVFVGLFFGSANGTVIGGTTAAARNVIAGSVRAGITLNGQGTQHTLVEGNFVGLSADGATDLGNPGSGVEVNGDDNTIGGSTGGSGNAIVASHIGGVVLRGKGNDVEANLIRSNIGQGVVAPDGPNTIAGNLILANDEGIRVESAAAGVTITRNEIFANDGLGINLRSGMENHDVTANDSCDADTGPNGLQNYPVLTSATDSAQTHITTVSGSLDSLLGTQFQIELFLATSDDSGHGEGQVLLTTTSIATPANSCTKSFQIPALNVSPGQVLTATATNTATGDTSEFSANIAVVAGP